MWARAGIIGLGLLSATSLKAEIPLPKIPPPEQAVKLLRECGFAQVDVKFDEELQEDVLVVPGIVTASDEQIACAARVSSETYYYLNLPVDVQKRFMAVYLPLEEEKGRAMSRAWLADKGLLDDLPEYDPSTMSDETFAGALEEFCGPDAQGALKSEYGAHAISPEWAAKGWAPNADFDRTGNAMWCLVSAGSASGFQIGLIGNEKGYISNPTLPEGE